MSNNLSNFICPYCGHEHDIKGTYRFDHCNCNNCNKPFRIITVINKSTGVIHSFETKKKLCDIEMNPNKNNEMKRIEACPSCGCSTIQFSCDYIVNTEIFGFHCPSCLFGIQGASVTKIIEAWNNSFYSNSSNKGNK